MIEKFVITNFQAHSNSELELHPNVNVIHGDTHSGKSSIFRAFESIILRKPFWMRYDNYSGMLDLYLKEGQISREVKHSKTRVCPTCKKEIEGENVLCECGEFLSSKVNSDSYYDHVQGRKYEKFGTNLPQEITEVIKIKTINFSDIPICLNFQRQMEDLFFVGESYSGQGRTKIMSKLIPDLDKIDSAVKIVNSKIGDITSKIKYDKERREKLKTLFEKIDINEFEEAVKSYKEIEKEKEEKESSIGELRRIKNSLEESTNIEALKKKVDILLKNITVLEKLRTLISTKNDSKNEINKLFESLKTNKSVKISVIDFTSLMESQKAISDKTNNRNNLSKMKIEKKLQKIQVEKLNDNIKGISDVLTAIRGLKDTREDLDTRSTNISLNDIAIMEVSEDISVVQGDLENLKGRYLKEIQSNEALCPYIKGKFCDKYMEMIKNG